MNFSLEFLSVPFGALLGAVFGGVMTWLVSALMAKRAIFRWSTRIDRIGFSMDSPVPDTVRVEWRGNKVPNLYMATMEVENTSSKDFENVSLTAHTRDGTRLLDEWTVIVNTPDRVKWSPDFEREVVLESTDPPTQQDQKLQLWQSRREYVVPVLNRRQLLRLHFLCIPPQEHQLPEVLLNVSAPGVRMMYRSHLNFILQVPTELTLLPGITTALLIVFAAIMYAENIWLTAAITGLVCWFTQFIGAIIRRVGWWLRDCLFN